MKCVRGLVLAVILFVIVLKNLSLIWCGGVEAGLEVLSSVGQ